MSDDVRDRLDIERAMRHYAVGLDERKWDEWDRAFTADGIIDFTAMGGKRETRDQMRERLSKPDPTWLFAQHPLYNTVVAVDGDTATAFSHFQMETGRRAADGRVTRVSGGGSYADTLARTPEGWRITERRVFLKWKHTFTVEDEVERG
ncbi:nuclear transport factor 2 family protein [Yinghuangia sp. ASG 101]|uniref:nuclear transport factor 2 family protein n=1 Tax=Yinghuangia sp. ASG 101 TaxID=2896848 RepID=UPI001E4EEBE5|nr:nuclear transport factor 2 family protein [Yinghuangia sp. ASG 101]UGQ11101.1 nuclear transport factor 2 family protein [Yinghuangia sp. ASG 101]